MYKITKIYVEGTKQRVQSRITVLFISRKDQEMGPHCNRADEQLRITPANVHERGNWILCYSYTNTCDGYVGNGNGRQHRLQSFRESAPHFIRTIFKVTPGV